MALGMMCFGSRKQADPDAARNEQIEKMIRADKKKAAKEVKLLLLGTTFYSHTIRLATSSMIMANDPIL